MPDSNPFLDPELDVYITETPYGIAHAIFKADDEDGSGVRFDEGEWPASGFMLDCINETTGPDGIRLDAATITGELYHDFCQPEGSGVTIHRPAYLEPRSEADRDAGITTDAVPSDESIEQARQKTNTDPTEKQKRAGNYAKGSIKIHGLVVRIENPKGSERNGVDASGREWRQRLAHDYGYLQGIPGADGDNLDVFVGPDLESDRVFIIDQHNEDGTFDEHKVMLGFLTEADARQGYLDCYEIGWDGLGRMREMSVSEFKIWARGLRAGAPMLDDAGGHLSPLDLLRAELQGASGALAKLAVARRMLSALNAGQDATPQDPESRRPTAHLYSHDTNRSKAKRQKANDAAVELLRKVQSGELSREQLSDEDKATLAAYSGSGGALVNADGVTGSDYEYYTPAPIAAGAWDLLKDMGFRGGKVLDPCAATGIFGALAPANTVVDSVELSEISGGINKLLNEGPGHHVEIAPFERIAAATEDEQYDAVVTNVPFSRDVDARGGNQFEDSKYQKEPIENYFILRSLEKLKPGGLAAFIVPPRCISGRDAKQMKLRREASLKAEFLGAYRLPNHVFGAADADTITDLMVFRKFGNRARAKVDELLEQQPALLSEANVLWSPFLEGKYFAGEGKRFVLGEFVPKDPEKFRDVDRVKNPASIPDVAKLMRKFPGSRIAWDRLEASETQPIEYQEGDTLYQSGQCLRLQDGVWVPQAPSTENRAGEELLAAMSTAMHSFSQGHSADDAAKVLAYVQNTGRYTDIPNWLRSLYKDVERAPKAKREAFWRAGQVGHAVQEVLEKHAGESGTDYASLYPELTAAMQTLRGSANSARGKFECSKKAVAALLAHARAKGELSPLWRGEVAEAVAAMPETASGKLDALRYKHKSNWLPMAQVLDALGDEAPDLYTDPEWCLSADGLSVQRADDYYVGSVQSLLAELDAGIAAAANDRVRDKLLAQKTEAQARIPKVDPKTINYNLFSPYVTDQEKLEFLRKFVHPNFIYEEQDSGKVSFKIDVKSSALTDEVKLLRRVGQYVKEGTVTLGSASVSMSDAKALAFIKEQAAMADAQFAVWAKANPKIQARINAAINDPKNQRFALKDDQAPMTIPGMNPKLSLHGYQTAFVRRMGRDFSGINGFGVGLGKAQPLDAKILTPDGWRRMGDIRIGDQVIAVDGTATEVTGVYPQGDKEIFEARFSDGSKTRCCDEHLWFTRTEKDRKNQLYNDKHNTGRSYPGSVKPLSEIRKTLLHGKKQKNHQIPMVSPVAFPERELLIPPYIMGVLLGDGSLTTNSVSFTPGDPWIAENVQKIASSVWPSLSMKIRKNDGKADAYALTNGNIGGGESPLLRSLREYKLIGLRSDEKFTPEDYLFASNDQRLALLRGLMDTDGYVSKDGITVQFSSSSQSLASDVVSIVQSLGGLAWVSEKIPTYCHNGERRNGKTCYTVSIRMPANINPFSLARKADRVRAKTKYAPTRYFVGVDFVGIEPAQCISVDHPSRLYVTDDYIVTHNTFTALAAVQHVQAMGVKTKTLFVVPASTLSNWRKEAAFAYDSLDDCLFVGLRADKKDPTKFKRVASAVDEDLNDVLTNQHRKIFMTLEAFQKIRLRDETIDDYLNYLSGVESAYDNHTGKAGKDERAKSQQAKLRKELEKKSGGAPYLEDMGVDSIVFDEMHANKNSAQTDKFKGAKYLSEGKPSGRGLDAMAKCWYVRDNSLQNDGVLGLTATPITNSPLEIYSMLSLAVGQERMNQAFFGIDGADDFMEAVCMKSQSPEVGIDGKTRMQTVFTGLSNLSMLRNAVHDITVVEGAQSVGKDVVVPERDEHATAVTLDQTSTKQLDQYRLAYSAAKEIVRAEEQGTAAEVSDEERDALEAVQTLTGEPVELIGHPFNLINKMTMLIADPELSERATFYSIDPDQRDLADKAIAEINKAKIKEERDKSSPHTPEDRVTYKFKTVDDEKVPIEVVLVSARMLNDTRLVLDTLDPKTQLRFEAIAERLGLGLNVSIPPKLAAMLSNFQKEEASPRGLDDDGKPSPIVKQIIFCDILPMLAKIKRALTQHAGVPASQIEIITGKVNGSPEDIIDVQNRFNAHGEDNGCRVIIANKKAEVGINLQRGTQAIHHLTIGWTPDSIEQRNGRGARQGNKTVKVAIYHYDADGTFDSAKRNLVSVKASWIDDLMGSESGSVAIKGGMSGDEIDALITASGEGEAAMTRIREQIDARNRDMRVKDVRLRQAVAIRNITVMRDELEELTEDKRIDAVLAQYTARLSSAMDARKYLTELEANEEAKPSQIERAKQRLSTAETKLKREGARMDAGLVVTGDQPPTALFENSARNNPYGVGGWARAVRASVTGLVADSEIGQELAEARDAAQGMLDSSIDSIRELAGEDGAYPANAGELIDSGKAVLVGSQLFRAGDIAEGPKQGIWMVETAKKSYGAIEIDFKGTSEDSYPARASAWRTGAAATYALIPPGSAEHEAHLDAFAAWEDTQQRSGNMTFADTFSKLNPEVSKRRKTEALIGHDVRSARLPAPYFPFVITDDLAAQHDALQPLAEKQKAIIKGFNEAGYGRAPTLFYTDASADVCEGDNAGELDLNLALFDHLYAQGIAFDAIGYNRYAFNTNGIVTAIMQQRDWSTLVRFIEGQEAPQSMADVEAIFAAVTAQAKPQLERLFEGRALAAAEGVIAGSMPASVGGISGIESIRVAYLAKTRAALEAEAARLQAEREAQAAEAEEQRKAEAAKLEEARGRWVAMKSDFEFRNVVNVRTFAKDMGELAAWNKGGGFFRGNDAAVAANRPDAPNNTWIIPRKVFDALLEQYPSACATHHVREV